MLHCSKWSVTSNEVVHVVVSLMTQWVFNRGVEEQMKAFLDGFSEVLPLQWLQYFDERELEVRLYYWSAVRLPCCQVQCVPIFGCWHSFWLILILLTVLLPIKFLLLFTQCWIYSGHWQSNTRRSQICQFLLTCSSAATLLLTVNFSQHPHPVTLVDICQPRHQES